MADNLYAVWLQFAAHYDTNWVVRATGPREACERVKAHASQSQEVKDGIAWYGYDVQRDMGEPKAERVQEDAREFREIYGVDLDTVGTTPVLYDTGT